jgi:hypothetical protein
MPNALPRSFGSVNVVVSSDSADGTSSAANAPWQARAMISMAKLTEAPPMAERLNVLAARVRERPAVLMAQERAQELHGLKVGLNRTGRLPLGSQMALEGASEVIYAWVRHASRVACAVRRSWSTVLEVPRVGGEETSRSEALFYGAVAQLEEHLLCKQGVVGSSPISSTRSPSVQLRGHVGAASR